MTLTTTITSYGRERMVYGEKGDSVELIATHGDVLIVKGKREKFSVRKENVNFN